MPKNPFAKTADEAVTKFALKAAPLILRSPQVLGNVLEVGEFSKVSRSICDVIRDVTCKDRIVMAEEIKARTPIDAAVCDKFMTLLNDAIQVYVQSDCADCSLIVKTILEDLDAPLEKKVQYVLDVKKEQHDHIIKVIKTAGGTVVAVRVGHALSHAIEAGASQIPKIADTLKEVDRRHEENKRERERQREETKRKQEDTKREIERQREETKRTEIRHKAEVEKAKAQQQAKNK